MSKNNRSGKKPKHRAPQNLQTVPASQPTAASKQLATIEQRAELWHLQIRMKRALEVTHQFWNIALTVSLQLPWLHGFYEYLIENYMVLAQTLSGKAFEKSPSSANIDTSVRGIPQLLARAMVFAVLSLASYPIQRYVKERYANQYINVDPSSASLTHAQANIAIKLAKKNQTAVHNFGYIIRQSMVMYLMFHTTLAGALVSSEIDSIGFMFFSILVLTVFRYVAAISSIAIPFALQNRSKNAELDQAYDLFAYNIKAIFHEIHVKLTSTKTYNPSQIYTFIDNMFTFADNFFTDMSPQRLIKIDYQYHAGKQSVPMALSVKLLAYALTQQAGIHVIMANTSSIGIRMDGNELTITTAMVEQFKTAHAMLSEQYKRFKTASADLRNYYRALPDNHKLIISCQLKRTGLHLIVMTKSEALLTKLNSLLLGSSDVTCFKPDDTSLMSGLKIRLTQDVCVRLKPPVQNTSKPLAIAQPDVVIPPCVDLPVASTPLSLTPVSYLTHSLSQSLFATSSDNMAATSEKIERQLPPRQAKTKIIEQAPKNPRWWFEEQVAMPQFPRHPSFNEMGDMHYKHIPRAQYNHLYGFISMPPEHPLYHKFNTILDCAGSRRSGKGSGSSIGVIDQNKINHYLSPSAQAEVMSAYQASLSELSKIKSLTFPTIYELHTSDNIRMIGYPVDSCRIEGTTQTQAKLINFCILVENAHGSSPKTTFFEDPFRMSAAPESSLSPMSSSSSSR